MALKIIKNEDTGTKFKINIQHHHRHPSWQVEFLLYAYHVRYENTPPFKGGASWLAGNYLQRLHFGSSPFLRKTQHKQTVHVQYLGTWYSRVHIHNKQQHTTFLIFIYPSSICPLLLLGPITVTFALADRTLDSSNRRRSTFVSNSISKSRATWWTIVQRK